MFLMSKMMTSGRQETTVMRRVFHANTQDHTKAWSENLRNEAFN